MRRCSGKANKLRYIYTIFRYQKTFGRFGPQDIFKLFDTVVEPILCNGSEILGYNYCNKIEKVRSKFCKQYCGLSYKVADAFALGECGRVPIAMTYTYDSLSEILDSVVAHGTAQIS